MWVCRGCGMMAKRHRLERKGRIGRPKKMFKKSDERKQHSLGGIPVEIKNGKIRYIQIVPNDYSIKKERGGELIYFDAESEERLDSVLLEGEGNFIRRHIYEVRFDIDEDDETDDERRRREYKEWWENQKV